MLFNSLSEPLPECVTANARQPLRQITEWLSALLGDDSSVSSPSTLAFQKQLLVWSLLRPRSSYSGSALQGELRLFPGALVELSGTRKPPEHGLSLSCQPRWVPSVPWQQQCCVYCFQPFQILAVLSFDFLTYAVT